MVIGNDIRTLQKLLYMGLQLVSGVHPTPSAFLLLEVGKRLDDFANRLASTLATTQGITCLELKQRSQPTQHIHTQITYKLKIRETKGLTLHWERNFTSSTIVAKALHKLLSLPIMSTVVARLLCP